MESFGQYIRKKRKEKNWTLPDLGKRIEISAYTVKDIEDDWTKFPINKLQLLAQVLDVTLEEIERRFLTQDLPLNYSQINKYKEKIISVLSGLDSDENILKLLKEGENRKVEFKSSLRFCLKSKRVEKHVEFSVIKNICAFLNTYGGKLIIGADDDGKIIGLENTDFLTFKDSNNSDLFRLQLDSLVNKYFGNSITRFISLDFKKLGQTIAIIDVLANHENPTFIKELNKNSESFYIRRSGSAISLTMGEFYTYSKKKWS